MLGHRVATAVLLGFLGPAAHAAPQTVTVQLVKSIAQAPYYIAVDKGYFAKEGIAIQSSDIRSALDTIAPMASGQLDVSIGAATGAIGRFRYLLFVCSVTETDDDYGNTFYSEIDVIAKT